MNDLATMPQPDLKQEVQPHLAWAKALTITSAADYAQAGDRLKFLKGLKDRILARFKPMKQAADKAKRAILDEENALTAPLAEAESLAKKAMQTWHAEQERKRLEEQRRLQQEAFERAERERLAALKKAAAAKKPETKERYQEQAAAIVLPVVAVATETPAVAGITYRDTWKFRIVDESKIPREFLEIDEQKLGQYARAMKEAAMVDGVEFYSEQQLAVSGR